MAFVAFTTAEVDADSPLTETFFTKMKDNFDALNASDVTNGDAHDHEAGDGGQIPQGGLKTAIGAVSTASSANLTLPGGEYGFYPQLKDSGAATGMTASITSAGFNPPSSYVTNIRLQITSGSGSVFAQQRYFQASPPYKVGNKTWGHFLYMLINSQGDVIASYEAEDPPYAYNGPPQHKKDSIERIQAVPHPFADYHDKDPATDGLEIILVDLREYNTKKWKADNAKQGKGILEDLGHINKGGQIIKPQDLGIANIQGFTDKVKIRKA